MDLWQLLARLWQRKAGLVAVVLIAVALGLFGWFSTKPSYSATATQALRQSETSQGGVNIQTGSFELGMVGSMIVQNAMNNAGAFGDAQVSATNAVVSPPAALPLVTITVTAHSEEQARIALRQAKDLNSQFLNQLLPQRGMTSISLADLNESPISKSSQPRIRSAGAGAILGGLLSLVALMAWDAWTRRRAGGETADVGEREPDNHQG